MFLDNNQNNFPIFEDAEDVEYQERFNDEEIMNNS
jgi:hypothetical protein